MAKLETRAEAALVSIVRHRDRKRRNPSNRACFIFLRTANQVLLCPFATTLLEGPVRPGVLFSTYIPCG